MIIISKATDCTKSLAVFKPPSLLSVAGLHVSLFAFWQRWFVFSILTPSFVSCARVTEGMYALRWLVFQLAEIFPGVCGLVAYSSRQ